ncbi:hypothetical protein K1T71_009505 [Dendrolimus kikuchii]|uniref:Uncharacterized protein n=1 Tax=Dendrolimus kikuchii TaxID=765133 RepID=A0ACC1CUK4_9NEOP|nr:hypothetical protein K1T71_009505 [Dendrolimus kikuchii]
MITLIWILRGRGVCAGADADDAEADEKGRQTRADVRALLARELRWLRRGAPPASLAQAAPHALLCPLTHRVMREPTRAADGFTYERANIGEWLLAAEGAVSPLTGRRMRNERLQPNYAVRDALRTFLEEHDTDAVADAPS